MKKILVLAFALVATPALAQWQVPNHTVPVGKGGGASGFRSAAPGAAGQALTSNGASLDPTFQPVPSTGGVVTVESCGATGNGVTDDGPAIRACAATVAAQTVGGTMLFSCVGKTYLFASKDPAGAGASLLRPYSNVTYDLCKSTIKVANNMNTAGSQFYVIYPPDSSATYTIANFTLKGGTIDFNGVNNSCGGTCYYNNIGAGIAFGSNLVIDGTRFLNNPGSQNITVNANVNGARIVNTTHIDPCDAVNAACTDHSSMFINAANYTIENNTCRSTTQSTKNTCWESWGTNWSVTGNVVHNYAKMTNIPGLSTSGTGITRNGTVSGNSGYNLLNGVMLWCDGAAGALLADINISGNTFQQSVQGAAPFHDFDTNVTADCLKGVVFSNNVTNSSVAAGTASTIPMLKIGRGATQFITDNVFNNGLGPAIGNGTFSAATSFTVDSNSITDAGQTSTAGSRRGILLSSATVIFHAKITNNRIQNVASVYMTTCLDVTLNASTFSWVTPNNILSCTTQSALTLAGSFFTNTAAGVMFIQNVAGPPGSTAQGLDNQLLQGATAGAPTWLTVAAGIRTWLGTPSGANLAAALTTALPDTKGGTGLTALGTGVATALGANVDASGGLSSYAINTWTPAISTTGTVGTPAYSVQVGSYEKIGRLVVAHFNITLSGWTGSPTGDVRIAGLPFTSNATTNDFGTCNIANYFVTGLAALNYGMGAVVTTGVTFATLSQMGNGQSSTVTAAQFGTTGTIVGACFYRT